jgi:peptide/nickel transport system ATP-binding protein
LARCIVGLEQPTSGKIQFSGAAFWPRQRDVPKAWAPLMRHSVQIVFQDPYSSLNPCKTVEATLRESLRLGADDKQLSVVDLLELVGLPAAYAQRKPSALSGGERQRVAIARALGVRPRLLICDEAVSALDVSVQAQILNLLNRLRQELGLSLLFISHDLAVVRQVADRAYVMLDGTVVEHGPVDRILDRPSHPYTRRLVQSIPTADGRWLADESAGTLRASV